MNNEAAEINEKRIRNLERQMNNIMKSQSDAIENISKLASGQKASSTNKKEADSNHIEAVNIMNAFQASMITPTNTDHKQTRTQNTHQHQSQPTMTTESMTAMMINQMDLTLPNTSTKGIRFIQDIRKKENTGDSTSMDQHSTKDSNKHDKTNDDSDSDETNQSNFATLFNSRTV